MVNKDMEVTPDVKEIKRALKGGLTTLEKYEDEINCLNVFPVPDGDTGTNLLMTMRSVVEEAERIDQATFENLAHAVSYGSLMGARGNSGVILSQIIRGVCDILIKRKSITPEVIVEALKNARRISYAAVRKPVAGTMLTIIKDASRAAQKIYKQKADLKELVEAVLAEANRSLLRTPDLLPILKEAGVVDAGGRGLIVLAEGLIAGFRGEEMVDTFKPPAELLVPSIEKTSLQYAYCTEFLLRGKGLSLDGLEKDLKHLGNSIMVAGSVEMARVHIHSNQPEEVLKIAAASGDVSEVRINDMQEQAEKYQEFAGEKTERKPFGIIAVASGEGVKRILSSLGVDAIVEGGQSMNPSAAEIVGAIQRVQTDIAIIFPNNKNVILTAQQAVDLAEKKAEVVPTTSVVQAFSAILELDPLREIDENLEAMKKAASRVKVGEVTRAIRGAQTPLGPVKKGDFIGLINHEVEVAGDDPLKMCERLVTQMIIEESQIATIIYGEETPYKEADTLVKMINERYPNIEAELYQGGQKIYRYIIGIE